MKDFYNFLSENNISPNGLYVLYCMENAYPLENVSFLHEQYKLSLHGFCKEEYSEDFGVYYDITKKAQQLLHDAEVYICNMPVKTKVNKTNFADWEKNIQSYNELFPKGKKSGSTVSFRTNPKELYEKFKWFFANYPEYTWEDVLNATEKYVKDFEESCDYTYMQTSKYFIKKDDKSRVTTSTLATMIYNMQEGNDDVVSSGRHYFGP